MQRKWEELLKSTQAKENYFASSDEDDDGKPSSFLEQGKAYNFTDFTAKNDQQVQKSILILFCFPSHALPRPESI